MMADEFVRVFDPGRGRMVSVPAEQADYLRNAGYAVGDLEARQMAKDSGWAGGIESLAKGLGSGATQNLSDLMMPPDLAASAQRVASLHPVANRVGQFIGAGAALAATGGMALAEGIVARIAMGALSGGTEEYIRAKEHNEPIQAERVLHGMGLGALTSAAFEGVGAGIKAAPKAVKGALGYLNKTYPKSASVFEYGEELPGFTKPAAVPPELPKYQRVKTKYHPTIVEFDEATPGAQQTRDEVAREWLKAHPEAARLTTPEFTPENLAAEKAAEAYVRFTELPKSFKAFPKESAALPREEHIMERLPSDWEQLKATLPSEAELAQSATRTGMPIGPELQTQRTSLLDKFDLGNFKGYLGYKLLPNALKGPIGAFVAADKAVVGALNNLSRVNSAIDQFVAPAAIKLGDTVRALGEAGADTHTPTYYKDPKKEFEFWRANLTRAVMAPKTVADTIQDSFDFSQHPMLQVGVTVKALTQAQTLFGALPKNPCAPYLLDNPYEPTQRQMQAFLEHVETVTDFPRAMQNPTQAKVTLAEQTNPEQLSLLRASLAGKLLRDGTKGLSQTQLRKIAIIMGQPVTAQQNRDFLNLLQQMAPPPPQPAPKSKGGAGMGVKGAQDVVLRDMTNSAKLQMRV